MAGNMKPGLPSRINVIDPSGQPTNIDPSDLQSALERGFRQATPDEVQSFQDQQTYGQGVGNAALAGLAGAGRGATFGLTDQALVRSGAVAPETLSKLAKYNPGATVAGEVAGVGAGLLAPELEGAGAALNPVRMVTEAGGAIGNAATHALVNPETAGLASKILSRGAGMGLGSAVEGAAYGLGQTVSEHALGDPDLNGEKVLSNIGYSALFGGALGAAFGGASAPFQKAGANALADLTRPAMESGDIGEAVEASGMAPGEKDAFKKGLGELRPDAKEIQAAASELGAPLSPAQLSANKTVRNMFDALVNGPPTVAGQRQAGLAKQGWDIATKAADDALGPASGLSKAEAGDLLQQSIASKFEGDLAPTQQLYKEIEPYSQAIPVIDKSTGSISRNIRKIIEDQGLIKGTDNYNFVSTMADGLDQVDNLQKLKNFRTAMSDAVPMKGKYVASLVREKLDNLETNAIKRFAETMNTPLAREKILGLIDQIGEAKAGYKAWMDKAGEFGDILGKRRIYGPQDFLDFIHDTTPEKFADKLFAKNNSRFMDFFSQKFPEEMEIMKRYRLSDMKAQASTKGYFDPKALFKQVDSLSPELKSKLFTPEQLDKLGKVKTYLQSFPEKFNPSNTSNSEAIRHFFTGPTAAIVGNARDFAMEQFINHAVKFDPAAGQNISHLVKLERMAGDASKKLASGAQSIFKAGGAIAVPAAIPSDKSFEKKSDDLSTLAGNPEGMVDKMDEHTRNLYMVAPNTAGGVQRAAIRANQFLQSKLPSLPAPKPFAPKMKPSRAEISQFNRYYSVVENPSVALDQVKNGTLTPETMETLTVVYPKLLGEMQAQVMDAMTGHLAKNKDATLPAGKRLSLSLFLGQDLDDALSQQALASTQMALNQMGGGQGSPQQGPQGVRPTQKGLGSISQSSRLLTSAQANTQRNES